MCTTSSLPQHDKDLVAIIKEKDASKKEEYKQYGTKQGKHNNLILLINDIAFRFATHLLSYKLIWKCQKDQFPIGILLAMEQCIISIKID